MKLKASDDSVIVFLTRKIIKNIDFIDLDEVNNFIKELILKLKKDYEISICGYYNVKIHLDNNFGAVLEFEKEQLEYFEYYEDQIDLNVKIETEEFVYEVADFNYLNNNYDFLKIKDQIFLKLKNISDIEMGQILEYSKVIYGRKAHEIIEIGKPKEVIV